MIIGLTGSLAAGKGVVSDYLKSMGFVYLSLSDELREIAKVKKIEITRENLQNLGNQLREESGSGVLAKKVRDKIKTQMYNKVIIDGIRNPAEILVLKNLKNFFLITIDAPSEIRFKRMVERNRESDPKTWEEFLKVDAKDKGVNEATTGQGVGLCMEQADMMIMNTGNIEDMKQKVSLLFKRIERKVPRPTWDEYFMKMAALVAERSTCLRHHVGAVIIKSKQVLTTGYNGAARGMKDCIQLGCIKDEKGLASGTGHEVCRAIHAEQNAIIQAGFHGISINGGTLYCTHTPCGVCAKMIVNAGIKEVITYQDYADEDARKFLIDARVLLRKVPRPERDISFKD